MSGVYVEAQWGTAGTNTRTEDKTRTGVTFLDLLAALLLMQPRMWSAFWTASAHIPATYRKTMVTWRPRFEVI